MLKHPVDLRHQSDTHTLVKTIACISVLLAAAQPRSRLVRTALFHTLLIFSSSYVHTYASTHSSFLSWFSPSSSTRTYAHIYTPTCLDAYAPFWMNGYALVPVFVDEVAEISDLAMVLPIKIYFFNLQISLAPWPHFFYYTIQKKRKAL